jgi:heat shock 70kDa protein 4
MFLIQKTSNLLIYFINFI